MKADTVSRSLILKLCLLASVVGLIHAAPNIWYRLALGNEYRGIALWNSQDELDRLAAIREVEDGNYSLKNSYLWEEKDPDLPPSSNTVQFLPYLVAGKLHSLLGCPMDVYVVILKFIWPALIFLLLTIWVSKMTGCWTVGLLSGLAATLMPTIWSFDLIFFQWQAWWGPHLIFMRPGTQIAVLFWLLTLICWERGLYKQRRVYTLVASISLSLTVYSYFFYWTFTYLMLIIFVVIAWRQREQEWLRHTVFILTGSAILSTYVWVQLYQLSNSNIWTADVFGTAFNHAPSGSFFQVLVIALMLFGFILYRIDIVDRKEVSLLTAFGLAHIVSMNQQVLTGVIPEIHHYEWFVSPILFTVFLSILGCRIVQCPNARQRIMNDIKSWVPNCWVISLGWILLMGLGCLVLAALFQSYFPRPTGGWLGKGIRFAWSIDKQMLTTALGLVLLAWGLITSQYRRWLPYLASLTAICTIGIVTQVASYQATAKWQAPLQVLGPAMAWLNRYTPPESVVFTSPIVADYLVVYTHNNVFFSDYAMSSRPDVFQDRALKFLAVVGFPEGKLQQALEGGSTLYSQVIKSFFFYWRSFSPEPAVRFNRGRFLKAYTPLDITEVMVRYDHCLRNGVEQNIQSYRFDYILEWISERPGYPEASLFYFRNDPGMFRFVTKVYDDGNVRIFGLKRRP